MHSNRLKLDEFFKILVFFQIQRPDFPTFSQMSPVFETVWDTRLASTRLFRYIERHYPTPNQSQFLLVLKE